MLDLPFVDDKAVARLLRNSLSFRPRAVVLVSADAEHTQWFDCDAHAVRCERRSRASAAQLRAAQAEGCSLQRSGAVGYVGWGLLSC